MGLVRVSDMKRNVKTDLSRTKEVAQNVSHSVTTCSVSCLVKEEENRKGNLTLNRRSRGLINQKKSYASILLSQLANFNCFSLTCNIFHIWNKNIRNVPATKGHWTSRSCWKKLHTHIIAPAMVLSIYINSRHPTHAQPFSVWPERSCQ